VIFVLSNTIKELMAVRGKKQRNKIVMGEEK